MKRQNHYRFQVETVNRISDTQVILEGRCCAGSISIDDIFTKIYRQIWEKDADGFSHVHLEYERDLTMKVVEIRSVRWRLLGAGETGVIVIETEDIAAFRPDVMLEGSA